jgi:hypothetical protein
VTASRAAFRELIARKKKNERDRKDLILSALYVPGGLPPLPEPPDPLDAPRDPESRNAETRALRSFWKSSAVVFKAAFMGAGVVVVVPG